MTSSLIDAEKGQPLPQGLLPTRRHFENQEYPGDDWGRGWTRKAKKREPGNEVGYNPYNDDVIVSPLGTFVTFLIL